MQIQFYGLQTIVSDLSGALATCCSQCGRCSQGLGLGQDLACVARVELAHPTFTKALATLAGACDKLDNGGAPAISLTTYNRHVCHVRRPEVNAQ